MMELFGRLLYAAPLLYIAVIIIMDPDELLRLAVCLDSGLQNFLHALSRRGPVDVHEFRPLSRAMRTGLRVAGAVLIGIALLPFLR